MVLPEAVAYCVFDEHHLVAIRQRADRDLRQADRRHDPAYYQPLSAGCFHRLHERGRLPRILRMPIDRCDLGERGSERRNCRFSDPHFDADRAQNDRDLETDGELREATGVELNDPSILLENLRQPTVLVVNQQQRAISRIPNGTTVLIHVLSSHSIYEREFVSWGRLCECRSRGSALASAGAKPAFVSTGGRQEVCATRADAFPGLLVGHQKPTTCRMRTTWMRPGVSWWISRILPT